MWQDEQGTTWLSYNDPAWLVERHGSVSGAKAAVRALAVAPHAVATASDFSFPTGFVDEVEAPAGKLSRETAMPFQKRTADCPAVRT